MFYLTGTGIPKLMNGNSLQWYYSESEHGKGAPDGVVGCINRTAKRIVKRTGSRSNY